MAGAAQACQREGIKYLPIVSESLGGFHKVAEHEIKKLTAAKARHTGQDEAEAMRHAFTRLSILIMRGNAAILSNRIPFYPLEDN